MRSGDVILILYVILLPIGAVRIYRRPRIKRLNPADFSNVPSDKFEIWRRYTLKSVDHFFLATWGTFIFSILAAVIIPSFPRILPMMLIVPLWFFLSLIISERYRIKANKLKKELGVKFSKNY